VTRAQARAELEKLGKITLPLRVSYGPFESEVTFDNEGMHVNGWSDYAATVNVRISRDVTLAPGGYGNTPAQALDALVKNARILAGRRQA
jgi:hypothetical protein